LRIESIEAFHLHHKYPAGDQFSYAGGKCTARLTTLVRVRTDTGHTGWGTAYTHPGMAELVIAHQLAPLLVGEDPREVEALWDRMYRITRWYGRKGPALTALGALDTAFWDLRAQDLDKPLWQVLGAPQGHCPAYASALLWKSPTALAEEAATLIDRGFRRVKMRLGMGEEEDVTAVRHVREAIGKTHDVLVDASMRYNVPLAARMASAFEELGTFWLEEPFQPEEIDSYVELRKQVNVRLAAGENEFGFQGFRELIRAGALDIVQPDVSRLGGLTEALRVAELAKREGLEVATHSWSDAVAIVANAHFMASLPHGLTVEVDQTNNPFVDELLTEPLRIHNGMLELGDRPGLGVEIDESALTRLALADPMSIPDGSYSDMLFGRQHFTPAGPYEESC
jgi:L-alanine-DL-glutamate epimerase-like enolase superfamily enzyme